MVRQGPRASDRWGLEGVVCYEEVEVVTGSPREEEVVVRSPR
jgi:hypothetical protein